MNSFEPKTEMLHVHEAEVRTLLGEHLSNWFERDQAFQGAVSDDFPTRDDMGHTGNHYQTDINCA